MAATSLGAEPHDLYNHADSDWKYQELLNATNFEFFLTQRGSAQSGRIIFTHAGRRHVNHNHIFHLNSNFADSKVMVFT